MTPTQRRIKRAIDWYEDENNFPLFVKYAKKRMNDSKYWENQYVLNQLLEVRKIFELEEYGNESLYLRDFHTTEKILIFEGTKELADGNVFVIHPSGEKVIENPKGEIVG